MKRLSPKFALLLGTLALVACRPDRLGSTGVQLDLITSDPRLYATSFIVTWMDETNQLFQVRVPNQGDLDQTQAPTVSVFIALTPDKVGMRRVAVHGYKDDTIISEGAARLYASANVWSQLGVPMVAFGSLPDSDGDGLPDAVDDCPHERDPCGSSAMPDAGETDVDAGAGDDGGTAPDAETAPDAGTVDGPDIVPTGFDGPAYDVRPS
jgi:hypothetical protein